LRRRAQPALRRVRWQRPSAFRQTQRAIISGRPRGPQSEHRFGSRGERRRLCQKW